MPIEISPLSTADIPGAITSIQEAFKDDPYNLWVYNDRAKVSVFYDIATSSEQSCLISKSKLASDISWVVER
jgi:hypothetical protein